MIIWTIIDRIIFPAINFTRYTPELHFLWNALLRFRTDFIHSIPNADFCFIGWFLAIFARRIIRHQAKIVSDSFLSTIRTILSTSCFIPPYPVAPSTETIDLFLDLYNASWCIAAPPNNNVELLLSGFFHNTFACASTTKSPHRHVVPALGRMGLHFISDISFAIYIVNKYSGASQAQRPPDQSSYALCALYIPALVFSAYSSMATPRGIVLLPFLVPTYSPKHCCTRVSSLKRIHRVMGSPKVDSMASAPVWQSLGRSCGSLNECTR